MTIQGHFQWSGEGDTEEVWLYWLWGVCVCGVEETVGSSWWKGRDPRSMFDGRGRVTWRGWTGRDRVWCQRVKWEVRVA